MIHAGVVRLDHHDIALRITAHPFGFALVRLWHLPRADERSIGRKFLHPPGHIDDEQIIVFVQGDRARFVKLARRRADAVVRYLTVDKNIPLRDVRMLGVGSEFPNADNKTRAARKENRRVDVKIYALNITGQPSTQATGTSDRTNPPK